MKSIWFFPQKKTLIQTNTHTQTHLQTETHINYYFLCGKSSQTSIFSDSLSGSRSVSIILILTSNLYKATSKSSSIEEFCAVLLFHLSYGIEWPVSNTVTLFVKRNLLNVRGILCNPEGVQRTLLPRDIER